MLNIKKTVDIFAHDFISLQHVIDAMIGKNYFVKLNSEDYVYVLLPHAYLTFIDFSLNYMYFATIFIILY